jgi:dethiobiotin synthase
MKSVFITGTDTGIGKTIVAASLLAAARARGIDAVPMKPVQTGCPRNLAAPDLEFCLRAAQFKPQPREQDWMCPYRFIPACSPHLAARLAHQRIQTGKITAAFRRLSSLHETVIVEGAGGVLVPIDEKNTMMDIMKALRIPVILVARASLGTINHTLLSLAELRRARVNVIGVVLVQSTPGKQGVIEKDNVRTIGKLGSTPVLACLPFRKSFKSAALAPLLSRIFQSLEK